MRTVTTIVFVILVALAVYILYKLIFIEDLTKTDNILFIILLVGGLINSLLIEYRRRVKRRNRE
jgi:divalent metal cation (Fe/Co/Zn/Cd) transporter